MLVLHEELSTDCSRCTKTYELIVQFTKTRWLFLKTYFKVKITVTSGQSNAHAVAYVWDQGKLNWNILHQLSPDQTATPCGLYSIQCTYRAFHADTHFLIQIAKRILGLHSEMFDGQLERRSEF